MRSESPEREPPARKAIRGTFAGCCAATIPAHPPSKTKIMEYRNHFFRFWIFDFRLPEQEFRTRIEVFFFMLFSSSIQNPKSAIQNYLITRSALTSTFGGIVRPICFAA